MITESDRMATRAVVRDLDIEDWASGGVYFDSLAGAFARHRQRSLEQAAQVADRAIASEWDDKVTSLAAAIRELKGEG